MAALQVPTNGMGLLETAPACVLSPFASSAPIFDC